MIKRFALCGKTIRVTGRTLRIGQLEGDKYEFIDDPETMIAALKKCGERIDLFTFMQRLPETAPKYHYAMEWDNVAAIPITTFDDWWRQIRPEARNRARQAEKKGVVIREVPFDETLVKGIWEIYNETPVRQGRPFPHYGKDVDTVHQDEATFLDSSFFIGAFLGDRMIGFVKITSDETRIQANLMNILSLIEQRDKAPTNALIAHSVRACVARKIGYLAYQKFTYGNKLQDGIMKFKVVNGFQKIEVPRYYVPLTSFGQFAFRFRLHHRLVDHLPAALAAKLRDLRDAWYNRKSLPARQSA